MRRAVVVLGGYGNFGRRIVGALAADREHRVFVAGRDLVKAAALADEVGGSAEPVVLDYHAPQFAADLRRLAASVVVHTAGPFQAQSYATPQACIDARAHYIDLADGRAYVCGIRALHNAAIGADTLVVSGASSLPALSAAVVDRLSVHFATIDSIEHSITSGARPPGRATMTGVLGYAGKPFRQWREGAWSDAYGWQDVKLKRYPDPIGRRWIASCDVPDLELFPERYARVRTVVFRAGVGFAAGTLTIWAASWCVRMGLMETLASHTSRLHRTALAIERFGTKWSAMQVVVRGRDQDGRAVSRIWTLMAGNDHGPNIPCFPAIVLARKILRDDVTVRGAMPCMGLLTVEEILGAVPGYDLHTIECDSHEH
jgi:saccharopine dehydrogenase-like NADP-dependent oxidoreductase